jgi:hypothetical protein
MFSFTAQDGTAQGLTKLVPAAKSHHPVTQRMSHHSGEAPALGPLECLHCVVWAPVCQQIVSLPGRRIRLERGPPQQGGQLPANKVHCGGRVQIGRSDFRHVHFCTISASLSKNESRKRHRIDLASKLLASCRVINTVELVQGDAVHPATDEQTNSVVSKLGAALQEQKHTIRQFARTVMSALPR